jgi:hypothetical protein
MGVHLTGVHLMGIHFMGRLHEVLAVQKRLNMWRRDVCSIGCCKKLANHPLMTPEGKRSPLFKHHAGHRSHDPASPILYPRRCDYVLFPDGDRPWKT